MSLKLFFTLHEIETKFAEEKLCTIVVFWWKWGEIPCLNLISSKFNCCNILNLCELFMFSQASSIKFFMTLKVCLINLTLLMACHFQACHLVLHLLIHNSLH
nr:hypothetical protein Iba_chr13cCG9190 [Ipomoea batatas]